MSDPCNPTPCCPNTTSHKSAKNAGVVSALKYLLGTDEAGINQLLAKLKNCIVYSNDRGEVVLADGSKEGKIRLPGMQSSHSAFAVMAQKPNGEWTVIEPDKETLLSGKLKLVMEAGAVFWESIGATQAQFNRSDIKNAECDALVAGFSECEGGFRSDLVRIPKAKFENMVWGTDGMPRVDGAKCIEGLIVSQGGKLAFLPPVKNGVLVSRDEDGVLCWKLEATQTTSTASTKRILSFTGSDQLFTVPVGFSKMRVKAWGAGASSDAVGASVVVPGGCGAFVHANFAVVPGTQYVAVTGKGGHGLSGPVYGFGGPGQGGAHQHNGGGLSGVFSGSSVGPDGWANALVIAGGGGAGGQSGGGGGRAIGGNGGDPGRSGSESNMLGESAHGSQYSGGGGGGGGYRGGSSWNLGGNGGTSFVGASIFSDIKYTKTENSLTPAIVPGASDADYNGSAGKTGENGLVIVEFFN